MPSRSLRSRAGLLRHPEAGHDRGHRPYFEGWYVKLVSADLTQRWALIPGLFRSGDGGSEAFVQVLDGTTGRSWYVPCPADQYWAGTDAFAVRVGANRFDTAGLRVDLSGEGLEMHGAVAFSSPLTPWPVTVRSPGAMGWYAYMPFMECYHGVDSFAHALSGVLTVNGQIVRLDGGRGYIEQDWGQAFPAGYVWIHSNHFTDPDVSLMASVALIPWRRGQFRGVLLGLRTRQGLHRFATYTGAKTELLTIDDEHVSLRLRSRRGDRLLIAADRIGGALLHAPVRTEMHKRVEETLNAEVRVRLADRWGTVLLDDVGQAAGLEVHGQIDRLLATRDR